MTKTASTRRARNQATSLAVPRQNSLTDNGRARQNPSCEMLAAMNKEQLRAECRKRGQRSSGNKNELVFHMCDLSLCLIYFFAARNVLLLFFITVLIAMQVDADS